MFCERRKNVAIDLLAKIVCRHGAVSAGLFSLEFRKSLKTLELQKENTLQTMNKRSKLAPFWHEDQKMSIGDTRER